MYPGKIQEGIKRKWIIIIIFFPDLTTGRNVILFAPGENREKKSNLNFLFSGGENE